MNYLVTYIIPSIHRYICFPFIYLRSLVSFLFDNLQKISRNNQKDKNTYEYTMKCNILTEAVIY